MVTVEKRRQHQKVETIARETIINFNEAEREASIFTYNKAWQQHLEKRLGLKPVMDNGYGGKEYTLQKDRIRMPQPKKRISEEQRQAMAKRLKGARAKQLALMQGA